MKDKKEEYKIRHIIITLLRIHWLKNLYKLVSYSHLDYFLRDLEY